MLRRRLLLVATATTMSASAVATYAAVSAGPSGGPPRPAGASATAALPEGLAGHFGVFRREATASDRAPEAAATKSDFEAGANEDLARRALTTEDGDSIYLVASKAGICLQSSKNRASGCTSVQDAVAGLAISSIICSPYLPAGVVEVDGVLPDGVRSVIGRTREGSTIPVPVTGNAFVLQLARSAPLPMTIEWEAADGHHVVRSTLPSDAGKTRCASTPPG